MGYGDLMRVLKSGEFPWSRYAVVHEDGEGTVHENCPELHPTSDGRVVWSAPNGRNAVVSREGVPVKFFAGSWATYIVDRDLVLPG